MASERYRDWIARYVARHGGDVWMRCLEASEEMVATFPELRLVKGTAVSTVSGKRWCHAWVETAEGEVLDPTATQFLGRVTYETSARGRPRS